MPAVVIILNAWSTDTLFIPAVYNADPATQKGEGKLKQRFFGSNSRDDKSQKPSQDQSRTINGFAKTSELNHAKGTG